MAVGVKLLPVVSDNSLSKVIHRFVFAATKVYRFLEVPFSYSENGSSADPSCLNSMLNI